MFNMAKTKEMPPLNVLLIATVINYLAQIPYYIHNYYVPHHLTPGLRATGLLGFTLIWFIAGFIMYIKKIKYGYGILLSFLIVETLFYGLAFLSGAFISQLRNHSDIIRLVFIIGYASGATAGYYVYRLIHCHRNTPISLARDESNFK